MTNISVSEVEALRVIGPDESPFEAIAIETLCGDWEILFFHIGHDIIAWSARVPSKEDALVELARRLGNFTPLEED